MKNQKGFSLVELLVVVIIIAIIAAIAIPSLLASRRAANEASAISSLRTIHSAQATYFGTTGTNLNYAALGVLDDAGIALIDPTLALGTKSGYTFAVTLPAAAPFSTFCASAVPQTPGTTGTRTFGLNAAGVIYSGTVAADCAAGVLDAAGGTAIQ